MLDSTSEPVARRLLLGAQSRRARGARRAGMGSGRSHQSGLKCHSAGSWRLGLHAAGQGSVPAARGGQAACAYGGCSPGGLHELLCLPSCRPCCAVLSAAGVHPVALLVPGSSAATRLLQGSLFEEAVRFAARSSAQLKWAGVRQTMQENNFSPCIAHA